MYLRTGILTSICLGTLIIYLPSKVIAQIIPDQTLPNNSIVKPLDNNLLVEGGTIKGSNLFHSFKSFSVPAGSTTYFNNSLATQNIITRITGNYVSNIDGLLKANGAANLLLINPNGLIFGPNARLAIGGSFLGTTANAINFLDNKEFNADARRPPLLTINTPTGLTFTDENGSIEVSGNGYELTNASSSNLILQRQTFSSGLQVLPGKTLGLVGSKVTLDGGTLTALGGTVELGSVKKGLVSLNQTDSGFALGYTGISSFSGIELSQSSLVDTSGFSSGSIQLQGNQIILSDGSVVWSRNQGPIKGGNIKITSSGLSLGGLSRDKTISSAILSETVGTGKGGDIDLSTEQLSVARSALISSNSFSTAEGGDVTIKVSNSADVFGVIPDQRNQNQLNSGIATITAGLGSGGNLRLTARNLAVRDQALVNTITFGSSPAGDSVITVKEVVVSGGGTVGTFTFGDGKGGNQVVNATRIDLIGEGSSISSPSVINAATFSNGDAGNLTINTDRLTVRDGARVDTASLANGNAGSLTINASNLVEVSGVGPTTGTPSLIDSSVSILSESLQSYFNLATIPKGDSGDVSITTRNLSILDNGQVSARNDGPGVGGTLQIQAERINLG